MDESQQVLQAQVSAVCELAVQTHKSWAFALGAANDDNYWAWESGDQDRPAKRQALEQHIDKLLDLVDPGGDPWTSQSRFPECWAFMSYLRPGSPTHNVTTEEVRKQAHRACGEILRLLGRIERAAKTDDLSPIALTADELTILGALDGTEAAPRKLIDFLPHSWRGAAGERRANRVLNALMDRQPPLVNSPLKNVEPTSHLDRAVRRNGAWPSEDDVTSSSRT